jgi:5-oxoprolinase (ATP-hydrolysing) subunit A
MRRIDLNADLGEGMGDDAAMLALVTSANVACGGHAGNADTMRTTLLQAKAQGVTIGAHPGYADRENFGRIIIPMATADITTMVAAQLATLQTIATETGTRVAYVKPHGALANLAAADGPVAQAILDATADMPLLAISGTVLEQLACAAGRTVFSEVFADRAYLRTGHLVPRTRPDAMIHDPEFAAKRLLSLLKTGLMPVVDGDPIPLRAQSICVHGDSPGAVAMARHVRATLTAAGLRLAPFMGR